jgi:hypothetical protein
VAMPTELAGDAVNFHTVPNDGHVLLIVRNANGASTARTLTIHRSRTLDDGASVASRTVTVAAGATRVLGPFPPEDYGRDLLLDPDNAELKLIALHV